MKQIILRNAGEQFVIVIGGKEILVEQGDVILDRGTAEFIVTKHGGCELIGAAFEKSIEEIKEEIRTTGYSEVVEDEQPKTIEEVTVTANVGNIASVHKVKEEISEEDKKKYKEELKGMKRNELIDILKFKEIKFDEKSTDAKLIQSIVKSL